jgi:hypothetical protein
VGVDQVGSDESGCEPAGEAVVELVLEIAAGLAPDFEAQTRVLGEPPPGIRRAPREQPRLDPHRLERPREADHAQLRPAGLELRDDSGYLHVCRLVTCPLRMQVAGPLAGPESRLGETGARRVKDR